MDDLLGSILGSLGFRTRQRGDLNVSVSVSLEEVVRGTTRVVDYTRLDTCDACSNGGLSRSVGATACPVCNGRGVRPMKRSLNLQVPPGIEQGASLVLQGAGDRLAPGRSPGDLEVTVQVTPHPTFERHGTDVHSKGVVQFPTAVLGGSVVVSTLHGPKSLSIPPRTPHGARLRMRGLGLPSRRGRHLGDHLCEIVLVVPKTLDEPTRSLVRRIGKSMTEDAAGRSAWRKLFDWFRA